MNTEERYTAICQWLKRVLSVEAIKSNQNMPALKLPYATVNISALTPLGAYPINIDGTLHIRRNYRFTVDINTYGRQVKPFEAEEMSHKILDALEQHGKLVDAFGEDLVYIQPLTQPTDISQLLGEKHQPRFALSLQFQTHSTQLEDNGSIETVEYSGTNNDSYQVTGSVNYGN